MLTCCPKLLQNFVYAGVTLRTLLHNPLAVLKVIVTRDLIIAEAICRHFWWHTMILWPHELPPSSVLLLSVDDDLVPCSLVRRQLAAAVAADLAAAEASDGLEGSAAARAADGNRAGPASVPRRGEKLAIEGDVAAEAQPSAGAAPRLGGELATESDDGGDAAAEEQARAARASGAAPEVVVAAGGHGTFVVRPALQRRLLLLWRDRIAAAG